VGLITLVIGIGALQVVLDKGNDEDWFNSNFIIVTAIISAIALAVFLIWELTDEEPIVDLKLFRHRNFRMGTISLVLAYAAFFAINLLVPQWLQINLGYTATWAGFAAAPLGILPVILTPFVGRYAARFDLRMLTAASFVVMGATCFIRAGFYIGVDFHHVASVQLLQGLGVALFFMPVTTILLSDLKPHEIASGGGVATFLRTVGASFAASLTSFMWERRGVLHHSQLAEQITPYNPTAQQALGQGADSQTTLAMLNQTISAQGLQISFNEIFHVLGWIFFSLVVVIWLAKPPFTAKAGAGAGGH
jgi:DHA2 family multidrug resistance protein